MKTIYKITLPPMRRRGEPYNSDRTIYVDSLEALNTAINHFKRFISIESIEVYDNASFTEYYIGMTE